MGAIALRARALLKALMDTRIRVLLELSDAVASDPWFLVFDEDVMRGTQHKYRHMVDRTYLRPRDMIQFGNCCLDAARRRVAQGDASDSRVTNDDVTAARTAYSNYLRAELADEIHAHHADWERWLELLRRCETLTFSRERFDEVCEDSPEVLGGAASTDVLDAFYSFGVIGFGEVGEEGRHRRILELQEPGRHFRRQSSVFQGASGLEGEPGSQGGTSVVTERACCTIAVTDYLQGSSRTIQPGRRRCRLRRELPVPHDVGISTGRIAAAREVCGRPRLKSAPRPRPCVRTCVRVSIKGRPHTWMVKALECGDLALALSEAHEIPVLSLADSLAIVVLMSTERHHSFDRAAARWAARLALERRLSLEDLRFALAAVTALPHIPNSPSAASPTSAPATTCRTSSVCPRHPRDRPWEPNPSPASRPPPIAPAQLSRQRGRWGVPRGEAAPCPGARRAGRACSP